MKINRILQKVVDALLPVVNFDKEAPELQRAVEARDVAHKRLDAVEELHMHYWWKFVEATEAWQLALIREQEKK